MKQSLMQKAALKTRLNVEKRLENKTSFTMDERWMAIEIMKLLDYVDVILGITVKKKKKERD